jgi:cell division protein FtsQ
MTVRIPAKWLVAGTLALICVAAAAWYSYALRVERIDVVGAHHADPAALVDLARVDTSMAMREVDAGLVEDRVRRHPWIASVRALRLPDGTLRIRVDERLPVAVLLDRQGDATHYLDAFGHAMPVVGADAYHVPLVRGARLPQHPTRPVPSAPLRRLLATLPTLDASTAALAAEFIVSRDGIDTWTPATPDGSSLRVRLGDRAFGARLSALGAFWREHLLTHPERPVGTVDLRFEGHLITLPG